MDFSETLRLLAGGGWITGEAISRRLGLTRAAVWKQVEGLRQAGFPIESGGRRGYRLGECDSIRPELWLDQLDTRSLGRGEIRFQDETVSTNADCKRLALGGAPHGSLCLAERQTGGRGRLGRVWVSEAGVGLWQSVLLRPALRPEQAPLITLCAAMAMACAVEETTGLRPGIKWPNDLVLGGRKICGILLELGADPDRIEYVVAGVGLNVLPGAVPAELQAQAAALADFAPPPRRREVLVRYLAALERLLDALTRAGWAGIQAEYTGRSATLGQRVQVIGVAGSFPGTAEAVDETGALLVRDEAGTLRRVLSGDVSVRGLMGYV